MLRKIRICFAAVIFFLITMLFLDFTGVIHSWFSWLAKLQLVPAILAGNFIIVWLLVILTLVFGRIYCSVICPLGVMQDIIARIPRIGKRGKKRHYSFSPSRPWLRYSFLIIFIIALIAGMSAVVSILEPYSSFGRIVSNLVSPFYRMGNNILASLAESIDGYAFYTTDIWIKSGLTLLTALLTLGIIGFLSWRNGRTYCNTVCPVGTLLGFLTRFSLFKPRFDVDKCTGCSLCERNCKASCINYKERQIDYSRCVACMNCIDVCRFDAMKYTTAKQHSESVSQESLGVEDKAAGNPSRRKFLSIAGLLALSGTAKAQKIADGGLAVIEDKKVPDRQTPVTPPGSRDARNIKQHCTACQLCITACPNNIIRPSTKMETFMQPELSFERGYCRPECTRCSEVCPTGAIKRINTTEKSSLQIGRAVWIEKNCVVNRDDVSCTNCERHCPTGAITLVNREAGNPESLRIPVVETDRCIGCGACENLCPARPFSAIYVEGNTRHHNI